ncbi:hypothetical protein [Actinoplanes sp. URMC 104]|uniref:hypothetical protein n=1 Tax=Actinoplanes sp. URMC 104 TaxID=3423409 RepID=UPI003F1B2AF3
MPGRNRRLVAVAAALVVFLAVGVVWLIRLVTGDPGPAEFVPAATAPAATTTTPPAGALPAPEPPDATPPPAGKPTDRPDDATSTSTATATATATETATRPRSEPTTARPGTTSPRTATTSPSSSSPTSQAAPPAPRTRVIQVGGVTLNNRNPRTMCTVFTNDDAGLPVRISNLRVAGDLRIDAQDCGTDGGSEGPQCRNGMTLQPGKSCYTGASPTTDEPGRHRGFVRLDARARCTSAGAKACSGPELEDDPPTSDRPVIVTWTVTSDDRVCYNVPKPEDDNQSKFCDTADDE